MLMAGGKKLKRRRAELYRRQKGLCFYCGVKMHRYTSIESDNMATIDHITPKAMGGTNRWSNIVCCCLKCNMLKGSNVWY
jgi:5-methylcytosine-specific restriction endonuclease McrA